MKYLAEFRDGAAARRLADDIGRIVTRPWTLMEICGGQTHAILRYGLDRLLPGGVELIHGPGCPVCVTPVAILDRARELALLPEVILASFGDMLRVPGSHGNLLAARAAGADIRIVYSPLDALALAVAHPDREVVFLGVGFETTAPVTALALQRARADGVRNFSVLAAHVLVPPAVEALLAAPGSLVQGLLAAGHVCAIAGCAEYEPLARRHGIPVVVTGFEPVDLLAGIRTCLALLERGEARVVNRYARVVRRAGNPHALAAIREVFRFADRAWRGLGPIPASGLAIAREYAAWDAEVKFGPVAPVPEPVTTCRSGEVLRGVLKPDRCPGFGIACTPASPLGAPMVSGEGACAAYWRHRREPATAGSPVGRPLGANR